VAFEIFISAVISHSSNTKAFCDVFKNVFYGVLESGSIEESKEKRLDVIVIYLFLILKIM
jgi:hypothetical protein